MIVLNTISFFRLLAIHYTTKTFPGTPFYSIVKIKALSWKAKDHLEAFIYPENQYSIEAENYQFEGIKEQLKTI